VRSGGYRPELVGTVDRTVLAGLRDRHHRGLARVLETDARDRTLDECGSELTVGGVHSEQLAAREPLGSATFVGVYMRGRRTDDRLVRPHERLQRRDVRTGTVEDEERLHLRTELPSHELVRPGGPRVRTVRVDVAGVRL